MQFRNSNSGGIKDVLLFASNPTTMNNNSTKSASTLVQPNIILPPTTSSNIENPIKITTPKKSNNVLRDYSNGPLSDVKNLQSISSDSSSENDEIDDEKNLRVLQGSPTSSPNYKSPKNKTLKHKRVKNIVNNLPAIKSMDDVVKLQEEITENRDKISSLQQQLSQSQKEKLNIEEEKSNLIKQLKELEEKQKLTEERERETKQLLIESEKKLNDTIESLHQEFDLKISKFREEKSITDNQLSILQIKNKESIEQLEKIQKEKKEIADSLEKEKQVIEKIKEDLKQSESSNQETSSALNTTVDNLKATSKDFFFSQCLNIKLDLLMNNKPCNLSTQELWEQAERLSLKDTSSYTKWITNKFNDYQNNLPPQSPIKSVYTNQQNKTTTTTTTTTSNKSPNKKNKKKN